MTDDELNNLTIASMKDTIAFLTANFHGDRTAVNAILGITSNTPDEDEAKEAVKKAMELLMFMTDLCLSMVKMFSLMLGCTEEKFISMFGMRMAVMAERHK